MKKCAKCGQIKPLNEFYKDKRNKDGILSYCKACQKESSLKWRKANPEKARESQLKWREAHLEKIKECERKRYELNKEEKKKYAREWSINNPEKRREYRRRHSQKMRKINPEGLKEKIKKWRSENLDKIRVYDRERRSVPQVKLNNSIANGIRKTLARGCKGGHHWESLVGYTIDELKKHLGKQFKDGMSWGNYGEWHIDHKIPVSAFNFKVPEDIDFKLCWNLNNLQPLWAEENMSKSNKLVKPFQPSLAFGG